MAQHDNRNRQRGGSQQEAYSQQNRQQGWHESSRQPQGDYGGDRDRGYPTGGSGDWRREQDYRGGYRDDQGSQPGGWRSRERDVYGQRGQDNAYNPDAFSGGGSQHSQWSDYGDQGREYGGQYGQYGQYGLRDRDEGRYGQWGQEPRERYNRPSGLDRDYRGAGYAGPGGYGGGYGGESFDQQQQRREQFDPDYSQWRREQLRALDDDYNQWRQDRFKKFSDEFSTWRSSRSQQSGSTKNEGGPGKQNKDGS